jgi:hypothetical protein
MDDGQLGTLLIGCAITVHWALGPRAPGKRRTPIGTTENTENTEVRGYG